MLLDETTIVRLVTEFLVNKTNGNWHAEKAEVANLHEHGVDIKLVGGKRNSEFFLIECKGKSYSKSANSVNKGTNWLFALGQLVTRMDTKRVIQNGKTKDSCPCWAWAFANFLGGINHYFALHSNNCFG